MSNLLPSRDRPGSRPPGRPRTRRAARIQA